MTDIRNYWLLPEKERAPLRALVTPSPESSIEDEIEELDADLEDAHSELGGLRDRIGTLEDEIRELEARRRKLTGGRSCAELREEQSKWSEKLAAWQRAAS